MSASSHLIERIAGELAERADPATLARLLVDVATGGVGAVIASVEALERAAGGVLPIDGARADALFDLLDRDGCSAECAKRYRDKCDDCWHVVHDLRRWLEDRMAPPCTMDQMLWVWDIDDADEISDFLRAREGQDTAGLIIRAHDALAGDDRVAFVYALQKAPVPEEQRALYEPAQPRGPNMPEQDRHLRQPPYPRWAPCMLICTASAAEAVRIDARNWADPGWLAEARGQTCYYAAESDDDWAEFDPAWPPDKLRERAARVAAGRREFARRRGATMRRNLAAITRARAATAAATFALKNPARAAAALRLAAAARTGL